MKLGRFIPRAVQVLAALAVSYELGIQVAHGRGDRLLQVAAIVAFVYIALKRPVLMVAGALFLEALSGVAATAPALAWMSFQAGGGVRVVDVFYLAMLLAVVVSTSAEKLRFARLRPLMGEVVLFLGVMLFEVARNFGGYGLSALGEFRARYLLIAIVPYVLVFIDSAQLTRRTVKWLVALFVYLPLLTSPAVYVIAHGGIGGRFLPASIVLGMVLGTALLLEGVNGGSLKLAKPLVYATVLGVLVIVLVNGHRSVWLAAFVMGAVMLLLGRLRFERLLPMVVVLVLLTAIVFASGWKAAFSTYEFVVNKSEGIMNPLEDGTGQWRYYVWKANLGIFYKQPIAGEGFGAYWSVYVPELGGVVPVAPHNLYVQTLVKSGVIGLAAWLLLIARWFLVLARARNEGDDADRGMVTIGIASIFALLIYNMAYPLDVYAITVVSLAMAVVANERATASVSASTPAPSLQGVAE